MFEIIRTCEVTKPAETYTLHGQFFAEDNIGQKLGFAVVKNGAAVALTNYSVTANVIRADLATVVISNGTVSSNVASIELPEAALAVNGPCVVHIRLTNGDTKITLGEFAFTVKLNSSDTIVDPGNVIPSIEELLAQIGVMEDATSRGNAAAALCEGLTVSATAVAGTTPTVTKSSNYTAVTPASGANPKELGYYEYSSGAYVLTDDTTVQDGKTYYTGSFNLAFGLVPASITSQVTKYQVADSGSTIPTGTWLDSLPATIPQGKFLWTQHTITWGNAQTSVLYGVSRQGIDGNGAVNTVNGISPDSNGEITIPTDNAPTENSTKYVKSGGVFSAIAAKFPVSIANGGTGGTSAPTARSGLGVALKPITVNFGTVAFLPFTVNAEGITADMIPISWELNRDVFNSDLTVTTSEGSVTISGTIKTGASSTVKITFSETTAITGT